MLKNVHLIYPVIIMAFIFFSSCSDDPSGPDLSGGDVSITVTGDIEAELSGMADFDGMQSGQNVHTWEISFNDFNPQTYTMLFLKSEEEEFPQPAEGAYSIGDLNDEFNAFYLHVEGNFDTTEFTTFDLCGTGDAGGTLTLENSTENEVVGRFDYRALHEDFDESGVCRVLGSVRVRGEFKATPRTPL